MKLEIQLRGTGDDTYPTWAYVDAGVAPPSPIDVSRIDAITPATDPSGAPITVKRQLNRDSSRVYFRLSRTQAERFDECLPVVLDVPVLAGDREITALSVNNIEDDATATEIEPGLWRSDPFCPSSRALSVSYEIAAPGDAPETLTENVGGIAILDPLGLVFDTETFDAEMAAGKATEAALDAAKLAGATVTLQREEVDGFEDLAEDDLDILPAIPTQTTEADGTFGWDVEGGGYRVRVSKPGYQPATSGLFDEDTEGGVYVGISDGIKPGDDPVVIPPGPGPGPGPGGEPAPGACAKLTGNARTHCARVEQCRKLSGKKRTACLKLAARRKPCLALKGKQKKACEKKAKALAKCDARKGKARKKCVARAKQIKRK